MKSQIKTEKIMDLIEKEIKGKNGSRAYFWKTDKVAENWNFYDYKRVVLEPHLVIENSIENSFQELITPEVRSLSFGTNGNIDLKEVFELIPHLEIVYLRCESISNVDFLKKFNKLNTFSLTSYKNQSVNFQLPKQLKVFSCTWRSKFQLTESSDSLEELYLEKARNVDLNSIFKQSFKLVKIVLTDCNLCNSLDEMIGLKYLRYLMLTNCTELGISSHQTTNKSLKYLCFTKVYMESAEWIPDFLEIDILILESCGNIETMALLERMPNIRGLMLSGNTKLINGDLSWLNKLTQLKNLFIRDYPHYNYKSINPWNWRNFDNDNIINPYKYKGNMDNVPQMSVVCK